jgi:hypothetical protein
MDKETMQTVNDIEIRVKAFLEDMHDERDRHYSESFRDAVALEVLKASLSAAPRSDLAAPPRSDLATIVSYCYDFADAMLAASGGAK